MNKVAVLAVTRLYHCLFSFPAHRVPDRHLLHQRAGEPGRDSGHRGRAVHFHHREHLPFIVRCPEHLPAGDATLSPGVQERDLSLRHLLPF